MNWEEFRIAAKTHHEKGVELLNDFGKRTINTTDDVDKYLQQRKEWFEKLKKDYETFLPEEFLKHFLNFLGPQPASRVIPKAQINGIAERKRLWQEFKVTLDNLLKYHTFIKTADVLRNPVLAETRKSISIKGKKYLILSKLKQTGTKEMYNVVDLLWASGVEPDVDEVADLLEGMERNDFVKRLPSGAYRMFGSITTAGLEYLEELEEEQKQAKEENFAGREAYATKEDIKQMNKRLDEVMEWLKRNDMGNEVLFNELEDMKEMSGKIDNKNWWDLVKGKIFNAVVEKAIEQLPDIAKVAFNDLAHRIDLPQIG